MIGRMIPLILLAVVAVGGFCSVARSATLRVPDDHKSIQAGLDAAADGDLVLVAPGVYLERIRMKAGVTLRSAGDDSRGTQGLARAEATIIDAGGEQGQGAGVTMAANSTIDGFTVTNAGTYDDDEWQKHHATQGEDQPHEHIGQPGTAGISVIGVSCMVRDNIVHHIGYTGIAIQGASGKRCSPQIRRNICFRNMGGGIGAMQKSTAIIEGNICFQNFYAGIGHNDASPSVLNNECYENIRAGIGISEGSCPTVRGNTCYRNRRAGIGTRTGADTCPVIEDNDCYENDMAGIGTEEKAAALIRNNRCYRNKLAGIGSRTAATPTIVENECHENGMAGIAQESDAVTMLIGNHCHHNKTAGIGFAECQAGRSTVLHNRVIDNALVAVGIHSGWTVQLSGNELSREGGLPPIVMIFDGAQATLIDNVLRGGGVAGIRTAGTVLAENNEFAGTSLRPGGPPNFAVWALPGSDIRLTENRIHDWRHGLHATGANVLAANNTVSSFHNAAFVIRDSTCPPDVYGNTAISREPTAKLLALSGVGGLVRDNKLTEPAP